MPDIKALTIKVSERSQQQGAAGQWQDFTSQMQAFTRDIETPAIKEGVDVSTIVSGVPSVFARADLFSHSLNEIQTIRKDAASGLNQYYINLVDEWRGLIACIALNNTAIQVRRINMAYSDGKDIKQTQNMYEPKGAFGNMLMGDRHIWTEQGLARNDQAQPFIYVIKYNGQVVGATSPRSVFFTSVAYAIEQNLPFVDSNTHRFTDPLHSSIPDDQLLNLLAYVNILLPRITQLEAYYKQAGLNYQAIKLELGVWQSEILNLVRARQLREDDASALPVQGFEGPFKFLNYTEELYGNNGEITTEPDAQGLAKPFKPEELLLPKTSEIARIWLPRDYEEDATRVASLPVYLLRAQIKGTPRYAYFAIPLSQKGIQVFGTNASILLGYQNAGYNIDSKLTADYEETTNTLSVRLTIMIKDGQTGKCKEKSIPIDYKVGGMFARNKDAIVWPNFIARDWNRYFLYSELPHNVRQNDCPYMAVPFVGDETSDNFAIITDRDGNIQYLAEQGQAQGDGKLLVVSDSRTASRQYKYEVYESAHPFKGVRLTCVNGQEGGFVLIHYSNDLMADDKLPKDMLHNNHKLDEVKLGIDFGSTNTSVAYHDGNARDAQGISFANQRISLFTDLDGTQNNIPAERNVLFFQNEEVYSNAVKSILAIHDDQRLPQCSNNDINTMRAEAVQGGFPCFGRHLPVENVTDNAMRLGFRGGQNVVELVHNMKWSGREEDKAHKQAFLSSLLLHIYAELYVKGLVPNDLRWSYPSAMGYELMLQYNQIWQSLKYVTPVTNEDGTVWRLDIAKIPAGPTKPGTDDVFGNTPATSSPFGDGATGFGGPSPFDSPAGGGFGSDPFGTDNDPFAAPAAAPAAQGFANDPFAPTQPAAAQQSSQKALVPEDDKFKFDFKPIDTTKAMTEASAVANYLSFDIVANDLTFCFDVGGSTTDISVLCKDNDGCKMLKQNSIRFAAQCLSRATNQMSDQFKRVLQKVCHNYQLSIIGFNDGQNLYSAQSAPYYFEQVVDQLSPEQLADFYQTVSADCPQLFCVDLYVTGLISFYAGQLATKLLKEVRRSEELPMFADSWRPNVKVVFAGKGSRIFEWLNAMNAQTAQRYYLEMFMMGMGGEQVLKGNLGGWPKFELQTKPAHDVKFEVSKGLAKTTNSPLQMSESAIEIVGENGFTLYNTDTREKVALSFDSNITPDYMESVGVCFNAPDAGIFDMSKTCFYTFAAVYCKYVARFFGNGMLDIETVKDGMASMSNICTYIQNMPEVQNAHRNSEQKFDYVAPIIIIEGMKFYDEYLFRALKQSK